MTPLAPKTNGPGEKTSGPAPTSETGRSEKPPGGSVGQAEGNLPGPAPGEADASGGADGLGGQGPVDGGLQARWQVRRRLGLAGGGLGTGGSQVGAGAGQVGGTLRRQLGAGEGRGGQADEG